MTEHRQRRIGGARPGAGRKPGIRNRLTQESVAFARETGETPLAFLLRVMRDEDAELERRLEAAKAAAPYCHARLSAVQVSGQVAVSHEEALAQLA
ncbi:hypothetical protein [Chromatocurvus halotolerans]|uniref:Uncharacterized protein n=1 Tax=Chromatocurvus halotolerans TaxID=1132028 RepID=A0A4R2KMI9_9GAMM|nr:hypothetical protein [Chromatocurvus halotolerans]TCO73767.1 hypothetical protein EV688_11584 [Chromatocurvus halotolerans]